MVFKNAVAGIGGGMEHLRMNWLFSVKPVIWSKNSSGACTRLEYLTTVVQVAGRAWVVKLHFPL